MINILHDPVNLGIRFSTGIDNIPALYDPVNLGIRPLIKVNSILLKRDNNRFPFTDSK